MREPDRAEGRPLVGDVIAGKYRIESIAGEGGMGIVYEAEHVILRQRVAVKALPPGAVMTVDAIERFSIEAAAIARITSEHVVRVMDAGTLPDGTPYLVMEYLDGSDLERVLEVRGPLPPRQVVDYLLQALDGLAHAHAAHVIHRDLKPANLFLARDAGARMVIKLVDFGISTSFGLSDQEEHVSGSPMYMSPEQLSGSVLDARTDLWSLGVVMYELLSGNPPFVGSFSEIVTAILERDVVPLHELNPEVSPELSQIVNGCLRRDREMRWSSTSELARALAPHGTGAWSSAVERIDRALMNVVPVRSPRRFESLDNALQALETEDGDDGIETLAPPQASVRRQRSSIPDDTPFRETILAPPSEVQSAIGPMPKGAVVSSTLRSALPGPPSPYASPPISSAYVPPVSREYVPPVSREYVPPVSREYAPPPVASAYVPPASREYAPPPVASTYGAPGSRAYAPPPVASAYVVPSVKNASADAEQPTQFVPPSAQRGASSAYGPASTASTQTPPSISAGSAGLPASPSSAYTPPSVPSPYGPLSALTGRKPPPSSAYAPISSPSGLKSPPSSAYAPVSTGARAPHYPEPTVPPASVQFPPLSARHGVDSPIPPSVRKRRLRILLIDDSEIVLGLHGDALSEAGFDVRATMSVGEFDVLLEGWRPHLVVMDVEMPGVGGDVLCSRVKAKFKATVPVVFVSGLARDELAERARVAGADAYYSKSSDVYAFVGFVQNVCAITYSPDDLP